MVTMPPEVVRMRASSTVFVNASSRVNRDLGGMVGMSWWGVYRGLKYMKGVRRQSVNGSNVRSSRRRRLRRSRPRQILPPSQNTRSVHLVNLGTLFCDKSRVVMGVGVNMVWFSARTRSSHVDSMFRSGLRTNCHSSSGNLQG